MLNNINKVVATLIDHGVIGLSNGYTLSRVPVEHQIQFIKDAINLPHLPFQQVVDKFLSTKTKEQTNVI